MPYMGQLRVQSAFTVEVTAASANTKGTGVTVAFVLESDKFSDVDVFTVPAPAAGSTSMMSKTYAPGTSPIASGKRVRVIIDVAVPELGAAIVKVTQSTAMFELPIAADASLVFDLG